MMFVKAKGRVGPETQEGALRFLTDLRAVNGCLDWSGFWNEWLPTLSDMKRAVPRNARWFAVEDIADAFEHVLVMEGDERMLTAAPPIKLGPDDFTDEDLLEWGYSSEEIAALRKEDELLVQWQHCPQGLAPIAPFWNVYFAHGMNAAFKEEWLKWMCCYVDDILVHGGTQKQCAFRQRLLTFALKHLKKRVSTKLDRTVKQEGLLVGMKFVPDGIVVDDHTVEALKLAMAEPVKTLKQARRVLGIINYAQESFRWDLTDQTWYADRLAGLHEVISAPKFSWGQASKDVIKDMLSRIDAAPRVPCRPDELLDDGWVIVVKTDASATGIGASLLLVKCADARDMTEERMSDPANVRLIATCSKVLSTSEQKWLTFETEAFGMVKALKRWGKFLMQVTIDQRDRWAVSLYMDSSTALSKWMNVDVPGYTTKRY
jgi:hypothetical protein